MIETSSKGVCGGESGTAAQGNNGRDARGRFAPGNAGGPGNPFARRVAQLRRALCETVTDEDIQAVAQALIAQAKQGDVAAARLLFSYTIGQPAPAVDPDTLDLAEWDIYRRTPAKMQDLEEYVSSMPAALACRLAGILAPCLYDRAAQAIGAELGISGAATGAVAAGGAAPFPDTPASVDRNGVDERPAPPSTNGTDGGRASRTTARPRRPQTGARAAKAKRPAAPAHQAAPARRQRANTGPSTNGANGRGRSPRGSP